ncbi:BACON domain-containing protein [Porphyromonas catoniae]|uniref:BACON domain-containing protein n=1 Tax=Porphyromonas catoniae TaxID=41976 RepID=UPI0028D3C9A5|nr:BACON domain-containing protein [Porphyromonas catoniae]
MRQKMKYAIGLLALLLFIPACKQNNDIEEPTLELSTSSLTFAKNASEQTVSVQTNKDSWNAFSSQEGWVTLTQVGTSLQVKVKANDLGVERTASVIVNAGGLQRRIAVKQSAADVIIDLDKEAVTLPVGGGTEKIGFYSNTEQVKVELASAVDWLTLDKVTKNSFTITAKANDGTAKRSVKVVLTAGTVTKEVEVTQEATSLYVLPLLKLPADLSSVCTYEVGRGHTLVKIPDGLFNKTFYRFLTKSAAMPFIQYSFASETAKGYTSAATVCLDVSLVKDNANFDAFLKENGLDKKTKSQDEKVITYTGTEVLFSLKVAIEANGAVITAEYTPKGQDKDYATFKALPMTDQVQYMGDRDLKLPGKKQDEMRKIEEETWGAERDPSVTQNNYDRFIAKGKVFDNESHRGYFYVVPSAKIPKDDEYIGVVEACQAIYPNTTLAFWSDAMGRYYLTKEVKALFADAQFRYFGQQEGVDVFLNKAKNQAYFLRVATFQGKPAIEIQCIYQDLSKIKDSYSQSGELSVKLLTDYKAFLKVKAEEAATVRSLVQQVVRRQVRSLK